MEVLGSIMDSHLPTSKYQDNAGNLVIEWKFETEPMTNVFVVKKQFLTYSQRVEHIIDKFSEFFPKEVVEDAKRINFDVPPSNKKPHTVAMTCLYVAADMHGFEIDNYKLCKYIKDKFAGSWFGDQVKIGKTLLHLLKTNKEDYMQQYTEKIDLLKKMRERLDEAM